MIIFTIQQFKTKEDLKMLHPKILGRLMVVSLIIFTILVGGAMAKESFTPQDLLKMKGVRSIAISPNGEWIAFTVSVPRAADDEPGGAYDELYLVSTKTGELRPFITGKVDVSVPQWHPSGKAISFLMRRDSKTTQVWQIALDGGEARKITDSPTSVSFYRWHPNGKTLGYIAEEPPTAREKALKKAGYDFIYYEEDWKFRNIYLVDVDESWVAGEPKQITHNINVWDFEFAPDGVTLAASMSPKNLIDHRYAFRKIYLTDINGTTPRLFVDNPGKLGNYAFSPDGKHLAYSAALTQKDNAVSQAYVVALSSGDSKNLTPVNFRGHVTWVGWKDNTTIFYHANEGVETTISQIAITAASGDTRKVVVSSADKGVVFSNPEISLGKTIGLAFVGTSPEFPGEVFYAALPTSGSKSTQFKRLTNVNPWLADRTLGKQEPIRYNARDGLEIEGLLIYPVGYEAGKQYPLVVLVHGGPESNYSNGWISSYSTPGQVLANLGYVVFYPNYRSSTGYGVEFAAWGYGNAAGPEFDDIADGIDHLINIGLADKQRVGLGGGSYGGYASAWFATYYTDKVRAVCMFVGISDLISKRGTTDIPYEELFVHSGKKLEEMWELSLQRSPIYHAHKSKTATLIYGGAADTRVHPSQSLELYRRMKMNDHPAVRLVQYPGEGHGNRRQTGRADVLYRILDWYNWYVRDLKPLDGPMPPLDISDKYGIELPE
jgi:dipeptidyl aminopeptidase/acylaminoacyl peptidase